MGGGGWSLGNSPRASCAGLRPGGVAAGSGRMLRAMPHHVSKQRFQKLIEQAIAGLPEEFAEALDHVPIEVRDRPSVEQLRSVGLGDDELLLGLYVGTPLTERSTEDSGRLPDKIFIFQDDCEQVSESDTQLVDEVRITVLHELGHYFGLDEDELDDLGYA